MSISYEFSKIRESFRNVKNDMEKITEKINSNYDEFIKNHQDLSNQIQLLSLDLSKKLAKFKLEHLESQNNSKIPQTKEILDMKEEIEKLKKEIKHTHKENHKINDTIEQIKQNKKDIQELKTKLGSSELEIHLLKERIIEKDIELKQIKQISSHLLNILDELTSAEIEILNKTK